MATQAGKELQVKDKHEVTAAAEPTRPGRVFTPDVDIFEQDDRLVLLADMPGVTAEALQLDLRDNQLTLSGAVEPEAQTATEEELMGEYRSGHYYRQFHLSEVIDQERIEANLTDGVLRLTLPKVAEATPRKITVSVN